MSVRVELTDEAVEDLRRYAASGNLPLFLAKLIRLEELGKDAGLPLGRGLVGWRKLVVGDRDDAQCYEEAMRRLASLGKDQPERASLAAVLFQIMQARRQERRRERQTR